MAPASTADLNAAATTGPPIKKPDFQKTSNQEIGFLSPPELEFPNKEAEREYIKGRLAGASRIFGHFGLNEGLAGHITVRDPVDPATFWVNPFGVDFNLIKKSDLLRVDHQGNILDHGKVTVLNRAAFLIHGAIHEARPDVMCPAHTHSVFGRAFCALGRPLDTISLESCIFYDDHVVFEGKGVVLASDEGQDIAAALGNRKAALLRNHGLLTVGQTIEEAVNWFYMLDKCCHVNLLADAAASGRGTETVKISDDEAEYTRGVAGSHKAGWMGGNAMFELIDEWTGKKYLE
ncbi:hypothetical protein CERZMDRAFT_69286 [Cercospora zeae-maydis SCOH1-5]|uniref:Class II aldolase/adducin N-terminal domain-containing protein n=1 Tax=Cercospora zeae-maydis SCOH1-5 TaxID=717836 RepID=A0A6A6FB49_9PEZI|nr:hypothetical protein CERZMDRAFT_69286 [Cercospora zeae-maydis SCOH1-5]